MVTIVVNGDRRTAAEPPTVAQLLEELGLDPERVAVEVNRKLVKRPLWASTSLADGTEVEVVQFVGGG